MRVRHFIAALGVLAVTAAAAQAAPITYLGTLNPGVPENGVNTQPASNSANPVGADYWRFHATAGENVTITGTRLADHYDMALWVFSGLFNDTNDFGAGFTGTEPSFVDFADDEIGHPGPFGDPQAVFVAPVTGFYTIAVTNFLSSQGPPNPYQLVGRGINVPEPASMLLLGTGALALGIRRRRSARK